MSDHSWTTSLYRDLQSGLQRYGSTPGIYVAYSGGVDSTVLLQAAVEVYGAQCVTAIHVHHGLSKEADHWLDHCRSVCLELDCHFHGERVSVKNQGKGVEAEARVQRYDVFKRVLPDGATLLVGQHLDDQIETFFLRLFRGAGLHSLQGMPEATSREHYQIVRPLLDIPKSSLQALAENRGWSWVTDNSNSDDGFDRNYLRNKVLPLIEARWPAYRDRITQTQGFMKAAEQIDAIFDIQQELDARLSHDHGLKMVKLDQFTDAQCLSLIHAWLVSLGLQIPSRERLQIIQKEVVRAAPDAQPIVHLGEGSVRRHGPALYWVPNMPKCGPAPAIDFGQTVYWQGVGHLTLSSESANAPALRRDLPNLNWRLRLGGESMRPVGRSARRDLKRLLQEYRIKPWLRDRTPLLFSQDELVAVGNALISAEHLAKPGEPSLKIVWESEIPD